LRENGGQYTHGSLWMAMAWARLDEGGAAVRVLTMMNPAEHSRNLEDAARYRGEPYIAAADVSTSSESSSAKMRRSATIFPFGVSAAAY